MLRKYFKFKEDVANSLLKMDQSLTEKEKEIEGESCWEDSRCWKLLANAVILASISHNDGGQTTNVY